MDLGGFCFCKRAQSYSPLPDTGVRYLCCSDQYLFPVTLWKEEPRVWSLLFMLWFASGDCEGGTYDLNQWKQELVYSMGLGWYVPRDPGTTTERQEVWGCRPPLEKGRVHIYGKEDAQQAKCYFTCALYFSHCALSRINVCGYLLSVTTCCSQHLLPSNCCVMKLLLAGAMLQEFLLSFTAAQLCTYSAGATYKPLIYCIFMLSSV